MMERSGSFTLSPKKRMSLGGGAFANPLSRRQSLTTSMPSENLLVGSDFQNNDEAERKARQLSRLQQLQARSSPGSTPADRRRSIGTFAGLTNQQLSEHYSTCIQLSAANKINIKNAFNLQLIDYMTEMLKRKDSDMNNFQVASCTLDASTKIYAYRVDSVHTDTLRMAGGLGRTKDKPGGDADETESNTEAKKRKGKHRSPIETNIKNINVPHFDLEFDVDPLFKKMATQFDEGCSGGSHFLNTLQMLDDNCQLILDSETIMGVTFPSGDTLTQTAFIPMIPVDMNRLISKTFASFEFLTWKLSDEDPFCDDLEPSERKDDHAFDMNAVPEPLDVDDMDADNDYDAFAAGDIEGDGTVITVGGGACRDGGVRPSPPQLEILHLKDHLSNAPLEYSYFDSSRMSAWAGPGHWKLKPLTKNTNKLTTKLKEKKKEFVLNYEETSELDDHFKVAWRDTKLSKTTMKKWTKENTTLPVDLHYNPSKLCTLNFREGTVIRRQAPCDTTVVEVDEFNYSNRNDEDNYCPRMDDGGSNYADISGPGFDATQAFSQTVCGSQPMSENAEFDDKTKDFFGDNLVKAPNKVNLINIGYAKTAKKMDMRKLKTSIWTILSTDSDKENRENESDRRTPKDKMELDFKFSSLYTNLLPRLSQKMAENLSVPLAFIALLHLANERNLKISQSNTMADFTISQG